MNIVDAAARGATDGLYLALNIGAIAEFEQGEARALGETFDRGALPLVAVLVGADVRGR